VSKVPAAADADAEMAEEDGSDNETDIVSMDGTESILPTYVKVLTFPRMMSQSVCVMKMCYIIFWYGLTYI